MHVHRGVRKNKRIWICKMEGGREGTRRQERMGRWRVKGGRAKGEEREGVGCREGGRVEDDRVEGRKEGGGRWKIY